MRLEARAGVELVRRLAGEGEVGTPDGLDFRKARLAFLARGLEADPQRIERALHQREVQVGLVLEVDVDQRPAQSRPSRDLVHGHDVPAEFGVQGLGGIHDLAATAVALFQAALGEIRHGPILSSEMTLCQYMERHPANVLMSNPGGRLDRAPPLFQTGSGAGPVGAGDPPAATG